MAARLKALRDDQVRPGLPLMQRVLDRSNQGANSHSLLVSALDDVGRGDAQGINNEFHRIGEGDIDQFCASLQSNAPAGPRGERLVMSGQGSSVKLFKQSTEEARHSLR